MEQRAQSCPTYRRRGIYQRILACTIAYTAALGVDMIDLETSLVRELSSRGATPVAVLIVIALAIAAAVGRISWGWVIGALIGIAAIFGAPQIVAWIRTLFGV